MIGVMNFVECLNDFGVEFFTGVPDSLLKSFCAYVTDNCTYSSMRESRLKTSSTF